MGLFSKVLEQMGLGDLFDTRADLSEFSEVQSLKFDDALHQAKIDVNEDGSIAAAAAVVFLTSRFPPRNPIQFICNHPFLFLIHDRKSKNILFAGVYRGPHQ